MTDILSLPKCLRVSHVAELLGLPEDNLDYACEHRLVRWRNVDGNRRFTPDDVSEAAALDLAKIVAHHQNPPLLEMLRRKLGQLETDRFVYFIEAEGFIKIGSAAFPERRLMDLQVGNHVKLRLLGVVRGGLPLEFAIHRHFESDRSAGEWFRATVALRAFVAEATRGQNATKAGND